MKRFIQITLTAFLMLGLSLTSFAQNNTDNASSTSTANVLSPVTVDHINGENLDFGDVAPGNSVNITRANGAKFNVTGGSGASVDLNFTLPNDDGAGNFALLDDATSSERLDLSFSSTDANWEDGTNSSDSGTNTWDPSNTENINSFSSGITVFLGGTITADNNQTGGSYSGTVTLTATYN